MNVRVWGLLCCNALAFMLQATQLYAAQHGAAMGRKIGPRDRRKRWSWPCIPAKNGMNAVMSRPSGQPVVITRPRLRLCLYIDRLAAFMS
jgi:hypothetical protein